MGRRYRSPSSGPQLCDTSCQSLDRFGDALSSTCINRISTALWMHCGFSLSSLDLLIATIEAEGATNLGFVFQRLDMLVILGLRLCLQRRYLDDL